MSELTVRKHDLSTIPRRTLGPALLMRDLLTWDGLGAIVRRVPTTVRTFAPAFEVRETTNSFVFKADLPGVKESDILVTIATKRLTIAGKRVAEKEEKGDTFLAYERSYGSFTRSFTLPDHVDTAHVTAELTGGELTVVLPKTVVAIANQILTIEGEKTRA